ncbi:hypothetical protein [Tateyamaria sp.]|uniref:hypothetical protein n=1 Tax=Tateyamaria sp. TaxID=1929288 RepID=UPI00329C41B5
MFRFTKATFLLPAALMSLPQAAQAADFGFVRWPGYLDMPIVLTAAMTFILFLVFKTQMPKGAADFVSVPKEERSALLTLSTYSMIGSFALCMGMVFVGMGLARAAEW